MSDGIVNEKSFTLFGKLPFEIRTLIWHATLKPRVVNILYKIGSNLSPITSSVGLPIALKVCHESRSIIIPLYPKHFGSVLLPPRIRVNFELDTVYLADRKIDFVASFFSILSQAELDGIQYFAVNSKLCRAIEPPQIFMGNNTAFVPPPVLMGVGDTFYPYGWDLIARAVSKMSALREFSHVYDFWTMHMHWEFTYEYDCSHRDSNEPAMFYRNVDELVRLGGCTLQQEDVRELPSQAILSSEYGKIGERMRPVYVLNGSAHCSKPLLLSLNLGSLDRTKRVSSRRYLTPDSSSFFW